MIEINQRGERDWAVYVDGEYKGTVSEIGIRQFEYVCTHSFARYDTREQAISFLVARNSTGWL